MEDILENIEFVFVYLDDVLIAKRTLEECLSKLEEVLNRLSQANVKVNYCIFCRSSTISGAHNLERRVIAEPEKVSTIQAAKKPTQLL